MKNQSQLRSSDFTELEQLTAVHSWPDTIPDERHTLGWPILEWTAAYLLQPDGPEAGEPFIYTEEQMRIILRLYEIDDNGHFVYRSAVIRRMKGWGKDPFLASLCLAELCGPVRFGGWGTDGMPLAVPHPAPWVQIAAVSQDQTNNTTMVFPGMISEDLIKDYNLDIGKTVIYNRSKCKGKIEAVTSSPRAIEGKRTSFTVANETHNWLASNEGHEMMNVALRNAAKSRDQSSRVVEITNAHLPLEDSVAEQGYEAWLAGTLTESGVYYDSLEAPHIDLDPKDPQNKAQVLKMIDCARGDSWWVDPERIYKEMQDPRVTVSQCYRFYFNIPKRLEEDFLVEGAWDALETTDEPPEGTEIVVALDGSGTHGDGDTTAVVGVTVEERPHIFVVGNWPEQDGDEVDTLEVEDRIRDFARRFKVVELVADPYRWQRTLQVFAREGFEVIEYPQTDARLMPATAAFRKAVLEQTISHDGNRKLAQHLVHAKTKESERGVRLFKPNKSSSLKIDLAIAAVIGYDRARWRLANREPESSIVYTASDFLGRFSPDTLAEARRAANDRIAQMIADAHRIQQERMQRAKEAKN